MKVGLTETSGGLCIAPTDAGRYCLNLAKDFDYEQRYEQWAQIVVQPNFDIVFLYPTPLAEATIARFAERSGTTTPMTTTRALCWIVSESWQREDNEGSMA